MSCQQPLGSGWIDDPKPLVAGFNPAVEPDSKKYLRPAESRRMGKILKRAMVTSLDALDKGGVTMPDAVITGTGAGCIENSEKFLIDMARNGEECLKPSLFMQSTHNTIGSLISIHLGCHGYNNTYSQKGLSFESALLDGWLLIKSGEAGTALVGSHDEVTPLLSRVYERTHPEFANVAEGSVAALLAGANFAAKALCCLERVELLHRPHPESLAGLIDEDHPDVIVAGVNGNQLNDSPYHEVFGRMKSDAAIAGYKNIFGDSLSSSALGFYAAVEVLNRQSVPGSMKIKGEPRQIGKVAVINHSDMEDWGVIILSRH